MIQGRRRTLRPLDSAQLGIEHTGLWLDKYMSEYQKRGEKLGVGITPPTQKLVKEIAAITVPSAYEPFYKRWKQELEKRTPWIHEASVDGRMVVGLGAESVLEASVMLHRTYGVPYIPGSALKGVASSFAKHHLDPTNWGEKSSAFKTVFGTPDEMGYVTFHDALYIPKSDVLYVPNAGAKDCPLHTDVLTVHHRDYYGNGNVAPADWDSPNPVPFLSATGKYLIALEGPEGWVEETFQILSHALKELGVGAKTSTGYGRMTLNLRSSTGKKSAGQEVVVQQPPAPSPEQLFEQVRQWRNKYKNDPPQLTVLAIKDDKSVELRIPGFSSSQAIGLIQATDNDRIYQANNLASIAKLLEPRLEGKRIIVDVKPRPKKK